MGNNLTAAGAVNAGVVNMIASANNVVSQCQGANCNNAPETQQEVVRAVTQTADTDARNLLRFLGFAPNSQYGFLVLNQYLALASLVAAVYNHHCGGSVATSVVCVRSESSVDTEINRTTELLADPFRIYINRVMLLVTFWGLALISFIMFVVFFSIYVVVASFIKFSS